MPPTGAAKPCTAPRPALASASPPNRLASARSVAPASPRSPSYARRSERAERARPSRHSASVSGLARAETKGSTSCVRASRPLAAITRGGSPQQQLRVHDRRARQHQRAAQARLDAVLGRGEHRVARHLRARCRRWSGWRRTAAGGRGERPPAADDLQVVERVAAVARRARRWPCRRRSRCRRRRRPPASQPSRRRERRAPADGLDRGLAGHRERRAARRPRSEPLAQRGSARAGVAPGDEQRARGPARAATRASSSSAPAPKTMRVAVANSKRTRAHQPPSSGKTLTYFALRRGSAIMLGDRVAPGRVVRRLLVRGGRRRVAVDLDQHEARRVLAVLRSGRSARCPARAGSPRRWRARRRGTRPRSPG